MEKRYIDFIKSLCHGTQSKKISWNYLDEDIDARPIILPKEKNTVITNIFYEKNSFYFDNDAFKAEECFSAWIDGNLVVFLKNQSGKMKLILAAGSSLRSSISFDDSEYGNHLISLLAHIRKQFPDPEQVIDSTISRFLNSNK